MQDYDNDGLLTASDLARLINDLTCASENSPKLSEREQVVGYVIILQKRKKPKLLLIHTYFYSVYFSDIGRSRSRR